MVFKPLFEFTVFWQWLIFYHLPNSPPPPFFSTMHPPRVGVGAFNRIYTMGAALLEMDLTVLRGRIDFREGRDVRLQSYIKNPYIAPCLR